MFNNFQHSCKGSPELSSRIVDAPQPWALVSLAESGERCSHAGGQRGRQHRVAIFLDRSHDGSNLHLYTKAGHQELTESE